MTTRSATPKPAAPTPAPISANDIRIIRIYDAPVALVWDAWTDSAQVAQWWGPRGFTLTTHSKDLRPGGSWVYTMHGPDGTDWPNFTRYHEVEPHARLVYDHGASSDDAQPMFRVTANFRDLRGKTELDMRMTLADGRSGAAGARVRQGRRWQRDVGSSGRVSSRRKVVAGDLRHQSQLRRADRNGVRHVDEAGTFRGVVAAGRVHDGVPARRHPHRWRCDILDDER